MTTCSVEFVDIFDVKQLPVHYTTLQMDVALLRSIFVVCYLAFTCCLTESYVVMVGADDIITFMMIGVIFFVRRGFDF